MAKPKGLGGRGLSALINTGGGAAAPTAAVATPPPPPDGKPLLLSLDRIVASPWQPRQRFQEEALDELAQSIREQGLIQPLVVREKDGRYELIAGERRFRALQRLGRTEAPAVILDVADARMRELALVENLQRADLNPIETAEAYQALLEDRQASHEELATRLGLSRVAVTNTLRLLRLPDEVRRRVAEGELSQGHAKAILSLPDAVSQMRFARRIVEEGLSVRRAEELCLGKPRDKAPAPADPAAADPHVRDWQERLARHLGTKVRVKDDGGRGAIVIEYYAYDDFARLAALMGLEED